MCGKIWEDRPFDDLIKNEGGKIISQKCSQSPWKRKDHKQISAEKSAVEQRNAPLDEAVKKWGKNNSLRLEVMRKSGLIRVPKEEQILWVVILTSRADKLLQKNSELLTSLKY